MSWTWQTPMRECTNVDRNLSGCFTDAESRELEALFQRSRTEPVQVSFEVGRVKQIVQVKEFNIQNMSISVKPCAQLRTHPVDCFDFQAQPFFNLKRQVPVSGYMGQRAQRCLYWSKNDSMWLPYCAQDSILIHEANKLGRKTVALSSSSSHLHVIEFKHGSWKRPLEFNVTTGEICPVYMPEVIHEERTVFRAVATDKELQHLEKDMEKSCEKANFSVTHFTKSTAYEAMKCPITQSIMRVPVTAPDGYTYEKDAIQKALRISKKSPMTNMPMTTKLYANNAIRDIITGYLQSQKLKKNLIKKRHVIAGGHLPAPPRPGTRPTAHGLRRAVRSRAGASSAPSMP